jgi:hypothetical protein
LRQIRKKWMVFAHKVEAFNTRAALTLVFFTVVAPFALFLKLFRDPLTLRRGRSSGWVQTNMPEEKLAEARRQG